VFLYGGVVGIAFHPDYQSNGLFYVDYNRAENNGTTGYENYIQEYHMNADGTASLTSRGTILKYPTLNNINFHTVDWIGFDPTANGDERNYLYVTTGDGGPTTVPPTSGKDVAAAPPASVYGAEYGLA
jgi:glucose/arabinose dehydrogenase